MNRKILLLSALLALTLTANAQFEEGRKYAGASLSGFDLSYNSSENMNLGVEALAGYFFTDDWMVLGKASIQHSGNKDVPTYLAAGIGVRYYIIQNGLYLGANCKLVHARHNYNDVMPGVEVGYAFYISKTVTIEPALYYDMSLKSQKDYSTVGVRVGFGIYI